MILFEIAALFWIGCFVFSFLNWIALSRIFILCGCIAGMLACIFLLPNGSNIYRLPFTLSHQSIEYQLNGAALWLMGFGLLPAFFACLVSHTTQNNHEKKYWLAGTSCALLGALGVFGFQDVISFFISWELMSFGVAAMLLAESKSKESGLSVLFMLAILETGAIALILGFLLLSNNGDHLAFSQFAQNAMLFSADKQLLIGILLLIGFGTKLGLLPFYEWLPKAYASGSGATGAISSGIILNAAFFGLMRGLIAWLPSPGFAIALGTIVIILAVITAVFTILNAFQQVEWPKLLSFSTAENAAISVMMLGVAILFQQANDPKLAALAGVVALIHIAGHSLAKGVLFISSDGINIATGNYFIKQNGLMKKCGALFGIGALFGAMSLCAMPPQAGFVSEWFVFQTLFHGFYLTNLGARLTIIFAGAGMALTAAIALATFVKAFGIGLLGAESNPTADIPFSIKISTFTLGLSILIFSAGMFVWVNTLSVVTLNWFQFDSTAMMHHGAILIPLSANFAFISPAFLIIVAPLLALIPVGLLIFNLRYKIKRAKLWTGGLQHDHKNTATTALTFSNALRYFYRFIYLPKHEVTREYRGKPYFIKRVLFHQETTPLFTTYLFNPIARCINGISEKIKLFQSGNLNFYNCVIGILFIFILVSVLF